MTENWLILAGVEGAEPKLPIDTQVPGVSAAIWETVSGGSALGTAEPPEYPWVIAVEGDVLHEAAAAMDYILETVPTGAAATPERFEEIYRRDDVVGIAADGRDIFYAHITVRNMDLAPLHNWYNNVHLPEVGAVGLVAGQRFRSLDAERAFLALYRPETIEVLRSDAIKAVRGLGGFEDDVVAFSRLEARCAARRTGAID
ncbi:MAG: hypothetical protein VYE18_04195 [Pseudomonadota bacterium]|nr:hypothetical protein [Pseudomonadota bacterium]